MKTSKRLFNLIAVVALMIGFVACKKEKIELPVVKTFDNAITTTSSTAKLTAEVNDEGGAAVLVRGFFYGRQGTKAKADTVYCGSGKGVFFKELTGLEPNTAYFCGAFARNAGGTAYSNKVMFTTKEYVVPITQPTVTTDSVTAITATTATCSGKVAADGGATVTARGVCYGTSQNPTISGTHTTSGTGTGSFTSNLTGLIENSTYYVRAYATNSKGTAYGEQKTFTTAAITQPTVTTSNVSSIKATTATCGGNVTDDGGATVTARGVCYGTSQNPTISGTHTTDSTGTGSFTSSLTGLTPTTTYYVRAYATNSKGTSYGEQKTFTTTAITKPTVTTSNVSGITASTATCGGNVTADGGATVTARGLCYGTSQNPTISGTHTTNGTGTGSFTSSLTGLTANTTYYVRAYATNSKGTSYGEQKTFTTASDGKIHALYSVSGTKKVYFSQGNLQYKASTNTWRFATSQLEYIGSNNANISSSYSGWIDLFGWGTGNNPTNSSTSNSSYSSYIEWGRKPISNGGNQANQWRTLTYDEWNFLLFNRTTTSGIRYAKATVNGVAGVIILPDDWSTSYYTLSSTNTTGAAFTANTITSANWTSKFEAHGAVFLPAAGCRIGTSVYDVGALGSYWSSSPRSNSNEAAYKLGFEGIRLIVYYLYRYNGLSVRLVADE